MKTQQAALVAAATAALVLLVAGGWWVAGAPAGQRGPGSTSDPSAAPAPGSAYPAAATHKLASARSNEAAAGDAFLSRDLRHRLELVLMEAGEVANPVELKQRIAGLVARHFAAADVVRATQLLERYVDYRVALGDLKPPRDRSDPRALRTAIDARRQLRERYFAAEEYQTLFAEEEELDRFTVARLEILRNAELTPAQKETALREAERDLGDVHRAVRREAVQHEVVAAQTAAFDAGNVADHERYQQRRAQFGEAAAQQLAQLDREERDWQARLTQYASAKAAGNEAALQALRQQLFSAQEQMRIDAALALRELQKK